MLRTDSSKLKFILMLNLQLDYEKDQSWNKIVRSNLADWNNNIDTIIQWSPYSSEADLFEQVYVLKVP